jgi:predicted ferric reductase
MNMYDESLDQKSQPPTRRNTLVLTALLVFGVVFLAVGLLATQSATGTSPLQVINNFLGLDSVHIWWYISRAAGLMGYLLVWLSTLWGFAIASKIFDSFLKREFTYAFHEHLSLLSLGFMLLHMVVLLLDRVEPLGLAEILIPFASTYRPFWTGIGIIAFYLSLLVTVTFYIRSRISMQSFRSIHYLSIVAYLGALLHGLYAGTDSLLNWTQVMYWGTLLSTVFFGVYWLVIVRLRNREKSDSLIRIQEA